MANYNEMAKADRDNTHALEAEAEFQTFLQKYPKDPLVPKAEQHLREVQEVLAEGQYRIAYYYYLKGDRRAAAGRLLPLVRRYPLYSKSDTALWMLGDIFEKSERKDMAGQFYAQIVKNYPLSSKASDARGKLKEFSMPIPQPDPKAMEWMQAEQNTPRPHEHLWHKPMGLVHAGPDVHTAAAHGSPNLQSQNEDQTGVDVLSGGSQTTIAPSGGAGSGSTGVVETVKPGEPAPAGSEDVNSSPDAPAGDASSSPAASENSSSSTAAPDANKVDNTQPTNGSANQAQNTNQKESSSKKKGLKKILPW
jgi:outer membrane protein assembly factor BamD